MEKAGEEVELELEVEQVPMWSWMCVWCWAACAEPRERHFRRLIPAVNAIMNRWANDTIPLLMNFPTGEEDSALHFCTSDS